MDFQNKTETARSWDAATNSGVTRRRLIKVGGTAVATSAVFSSFPAPWVRAAEPVKIGYVSPQTGPLAPFAEADNFIIGAARDLFKKQDLPIEIIVKDSQTNS